MAERKSRKDEKTGTPPAASEARPAEARPAEAPRNYAPRGIAALLAPVVRPVLKKQAPGAATLAEDWEGIVGPDLAARSLPVKLAAGTLTIATTGPEALALQHHAPQLIARINLALGRERVVRLRFVQRPIAEEPPARHEPEEDQAVALPDTLPEGPVGEALAGLYRALHRQLRRPPR